MSKKRDLFEPMEMTQAEIAVFYDQINRLVGAYLAQPTADDRVRHLLKRKGIRQEDGRFELRDRLALYDDELTLAAVVQTSMMDRHRVYSVQELLRALSHQTDVCLPAFLTFLMTGVGT